MLPTIFKNKKEGDIFSTTFDTLLDGFKKDFDRVFNSVPVEWNEEKNQAIYEFDVPGFNKDNLTVILDNGILSIKGETETRKFSQQQTVGNAEDIEAEITDGILRIVVKYPTKETSKKIEVK